MCAEKAPCDCHRSTLVGRKMKEKGCEVYHILPDGMIETQEELEDKLLERHYPMKDQLDLFGIDPLSKLDRAYEIQSNQIVAVNGKRVLKEQYSAPK